MEGILIPARPSDGPFIHVPRMSTIRPRWPFTLNRDSPQAEGLVAWYPLMPFVDAYDLANGLFKLTNQGPVWTTDSEMGAVPLFVDESTEYFEAAVTPVTGFPCSMAVWGLSDEATDGMLIGVANSSVDTNWGPRLLFDVPGEDIKAQYQFEGSTRSAETTASAGLNNWFHAAAVFQSNGDLAAFLNGTNKVSDTTGGSFPSGIDTLSIGRLGRLTPANYFSGRIRDARFYDRVLTDAEIYQQWSPRSRWDLYYELGRVFYSIPAVVAVPTLRVVRSGLVWR